MNEPQPAKVFRRLKPLRKRASLSEIIFRVNTLTNRENVSRGYGNDPKFEDDYGEPDKKSGVA